jgi:hypothetical protein
MSRSTPGIIPRGSHKPAKNIRGKNASRPMTLAPFAVLATAAIISPMGKSPVTLVRRRRRSRDR